MKKPYFLLSISTLSLLILLIFKYLKKPSIKYSPYSDSIEYYTIGDGKTLKIGILSDSQLQPSESEKKYEPFTNHLKKALTFLLKEKVEVIIFAGDIGEKGTKYAFDLFNKTYKSIFNSSSYEPILNIIMGNHDYLNDEIESIEIKQQRFENSIFQKPFSHKVINNFHFINWGSEDSSDDHCNMNITWAKNQIEYSIKNSTNEKNPIFITTHVNPKNTVYGSDDWGNKMIFDLFNNYNQIISFSGHSHYPLIDERSIFQDNFTAIQTQAVAYLDCEYGFENGKMIKDQFDDWNLSLRNPMGIIANVDIGKIVFKRFSIENFSFYDKEWIVDFPIFKKDFRYLNNSRFEKSKKPFFDFEVKEFLNGGFFENNQIKKFDNDINYFNKINKISKINNVSDVIVVDYYNNLPIIEFKQAIHDNFVHHYKLDFYNEKGFYQSYYYISDFFLMPNDRKEYIRFKITRKLDPGNYTLRIYAVESFGKMSDNYVQGKVTQFEEPFQN